MDQESCYYQCESNGDIGIFDTKDHRSKNPASYCSYIFMPADEVSNGRRIFIVEGHKGPSRAVTQEIIVSESSEHLDMGIEIASEGRCSDKAAPASATSFSSLFTFFAPVPLKVILRSGVSESLDDMIKFALLIPSEVGENTTSNKHGPEDII